MLNLINGQKILIPMDQTQNDHLKAYGIAYYVLKRNINVEWLLNFQGGSFLIDSHAFIQAECKIRGVTFLEVENQMVEIYTLTTVLSPCNIPTSLFLIDLTPALFLSSLS